MGRPEDDGHPPVLVALRRQQIKSRPGIHKQDKRRRPRSFVDPREIRAAAGAHQARRQGRSRTTVDMADVLIALEMRRLQHQAAALSGTPPGSRSSLSSLSCASSCTSSGSIGPIGCGRTDGPPPPPPYESDHRKVESPALFAPPPGFDTSGPAFISSGIHRDARLTPPADIIPQTDGTSLCAAVSASTVCEPHHNEIHIDVADPDLVDTLVDFRSLEYGGAIDDEEESSFDGVTEGQLEKMRRLQVRQQLLLMEQAQLSNLASPAPVGVLGPPPDFESAEPNQSQLPPPPAEFIGALSHSTSLPMYCPAPPGFTDQGDELDDEALANMFSSI